MYLRFGLKRILENRVTNSSDLTHILATDNPEVPILAPLSAPAAVKQFSMRVRKDKDKRRGETHSDGDEGKRTCS